jgi:thiamine biosynthesis lipoprotein
MKWHGLACLSLSLFLILSWGCNTPVPPPVTIFANTQMTMQYRVLIGDSLNPNDKKAVQSIIEAVFTKINKIYNNWNPESELSFLNNLKSGVKYPISKELANFLQKTESIVHISESKFDPSIAPLLKLWKEKLKNKLIPSSNEINLVAEAVGWNHFHIYDGLFWKDHDFSSLDLGGIVKGYAIDLIVEGLNSVGYANVFVEWGGEMRASGTHPEGRPWQVCVSKLGNSHSQVAVISLNDVAVASSGDYFQNWTVGGVTYFHIIDPIKHTPLIATYDSICSVSVTAPTCMLADALATTAMLFPTVDESKKWLQKMKEHFPSIKYWIMTRSKEN